eukprot:5286384-Prymnesium_polylepis.1
MKAELTPEEAADRAAAELMRSALHRVLHDAHTEEEGRAAREAAARRREMIDRERPIARLAAYVSFVMYDRTEYRFGFAASIELFPAHWA